MKKILYILIFMIGIIKVNAFDLTENFYYDTKVQNMYITKVKGDLKKNGAPFMLHKSNGDLVYCIEPFLYLDSSDYQGYYGFNDLFNISEETINKMNIIAHYGYGYEGHTDLKWYGITQYLIWEALPLDDIYFTDSYNGNKIIAYQDELKEMRTLIDSYNILPSFNDEYNVEQDTTLRITDSNNVLNNYDIIADNMDIKKEDNNLIINNLQEGTYKIEFIKKDNSKNYELYYNKKGQDVLFPGKINDIKKVITINVKKGRLNVTKHDYETDKARGKLTFENAKYGIFDLDDNLIKELTLNNLASSTTELKFGKYYLKELEAPIGYLKNDQKYYFEINFNNSNINLDVYDNIISKNVVIYKLYGNKKSAIYSYEKDALFELYDEDNNLIGTYKTDENGIINLNLVYGRYTLHQVSTKEGYDKVDDYIIEVKDDKDEIIKLYDYETIVDVPNTYKDDIDYKESILIIIGMMLFNIGIYAYRKNISIH